LAALVCFIAIYLSEPLPADFPQPIKYKLICLGADSLYYVGHFLEKFGIMHRINVTRLAYHISMGIFNVRDPNDGILVSDQLVENRVPIRIYRPQNLSAEALHPCILYFHGGGYLIGTADVLEPITYLLSKNTNYIVIYTEFRLIPEHKYPAAVDDSLLVVKYLISKHKEYNVDLNKLIIMGDSAGGNLAAVISQTLLKHKIARPKLQALIYPLLQLFDLTLPSYQAVLKKRLLGTIDHENFKNFFYYYTGYEVDDSIFANGHTTKQQKESPLAHYVSRQFLQKSVHYNDNSVCQRSLLNDTTEKYASMSQILLSSNVSPLLVDDSFLLENTPMFTYVVTTGMDILRDDGFIYVERLRHLGLHVVHDHFEHLFHGTLSLLHGPLRFDASHDLLSIISKKIVETVDKQTVDV
jgi:acetyl esterase/lipase